MKQKVIILREVTDSVFDLERLRIHEIEKKGYFVEVWSLDKMCFPDVTKTFTPESSWNIKYIQSRQDYRKNLSVNKSAIFFDLLGEMKNYPEKRWARMQLAKAKCRCYIFFFNPLPKLVPDTTKEPNVIGDNNVFPKEPKQKSCKVVTIINNIRKVGFVFYVRQLVQGKIIDRWEKHVLEGHLPQKAFLSTEKNKRAVPEVYKNVPIVYTHTWDYEQYLSEDKLKSTQDNICVFIDQAETHHPDYAYKGLRVFESKESIENYYRALDHFFDKVEQKYDCSVVIAAHPRSQYKGTEFGNRKMVKNQTIQLIASAKMVLVRGSTAISYITLFHKPFILIDNIESAKLPGLDRLAMQRLFNAKRLMIEEVDSVDLDDYIVDDISLMNEYVKNYIVEDESDKEKRFWDIVFDAL